MEPEYEDVLISKEVAEENIDDDTLLVVVDTHKYNFLESQEVLKKAKKIVTFSSVNSLNILSLSNFLYSPKSTFIL